MVCNIMRSYYDNHEIILRNEVNVSTALPAVDMVMVKQLVAFLLEVL